MPKVSIIIPVYNIQRYLPKCLESAISQTFSDIEIVCVNDGSTDSSSEIIRKYAQSDPRIRQIDKANGGLPAARRTGIDNAVGEYIFHLDGDDDIPVDTIKKLVEASEDGKYDIVVGDYVTYDSEGRASSVDSEITGHLDSEAYMKYILTRGLFNVWGKLIKRSLYTDHDINLPPHIHMAEDLVHVFQLAYFASTIAPCHSTCYHYYIRSSSMSKSKVIGELTDRSIFAVEFLNDFRIAHKIDAIDKEMNKYTADFLYTYLQSPHKVSLHKQRLQGLANIVTPATIKGNPNTLKRTALYISKRNLNLAKAIVKLAQKIRQ